MARKFVHLASLVQHLVSSSSHIFFVSDEVRREDECG